jgi:flagellar motor switch protein FliM
MSDEPTDDDGSSLADEWGAALAEQGAISSTDNDGVAAEWASMMEEEPEHDENDPGADRILSQKEIDEITGFVKLDPFNTVGTGARMIADSGRVSHERLPMLEIVFDRMVRLMSTSLRNFFQGNVEVTIEGITSVRFGDYLDSIPLPALLGVIKAEGWDNYALMTIESTLTYAALDSLLGGGRPTAVTRIDGRAFTFIETQLIRRFINVALNDAETAFAPLSPVKFVVDRVETNPRFAMITRHANASILVDLRIDLEGNGGTLQILLPYATIEPIRPLLLQSFVGEKLGRDMTWESHFATQIWQADVAIEAVLHETSLPLRQVLEWKKGDTILFEARSDTPVTLRCGDMLLSEGRIGRVDDYVAIQVSRPLRRSHTTIDAFEASASGVHKG